MIGAVICELNPLHNGHAYLFRQMHKDGCKVIACMSGHFTQRGEPAVFDKYTRTKAALLSGADLVIELPATYACAGAERFAFGGVYLLQALGCVDRLYCGSECGDTARLEQAAQAVADTAVENTLRHYLREGITYAAAREKAVRRLYGEETAAVLTNPNDILGTEYAKALHRLHSPIQLHTIQRVAVAHDSDTPDGQFASASYLRQQLYREQTIDAYIPSSVKALFNAARQHLSGDRNKAIESMLLYRLRTMTPQDFAALPDISEGLENRLYEAVRSCISIDGILSYVKSKRYPLSRLRRLLLYAFLQWTQADCEELPPYIQVLGFSRQGQDILHEAKKSASLPLITRHADTACLTDEGKRFYALMCRCDDLYALTGATVLPCGVTQRTRIIFDKNIPL